MKIEIEGNSVSYNLHYGDNLLKINDEEVFKGDKDAIIKKLIKIIEAWIQMKNIHLHIDKAFFNKMQKDKLNREIKLNTKFTWEEYIEILFGFARYMKL